MYLGTIPNGVSSPCGLVTNTTEFTAAPRSEAMSLPSTIGGIAATRLCTSAKESALACVERTLLSAWSCC